MPGKRELFNGKSKQAKKREGVWGRRLYYYKTEFYDRVGQEVFTFSVSFHHGMLRDGIYVCRVCPL
jgi:hypothetical protein